MNPFLKQLIISGVVADAAGEYLPLHSNTSLEQCEFLQAIVRRSEAVECLEVGLAYGISAIAICEAAAERTGGTLTTVDPFQCTAWSNVGIVNIERAGYSGMATHFEEHSQTLLPYLLRQGARFDFVYVDTTKVFDAVLLDAYFATRLLRVGGVVVFDDCSWPGVRKVMRYLTQWPHLSLFDTHATRRPRLMANAGGKLAKVIPGSRRLLRSEIVQPDSELGIAAECVAFQKTAEDERPWDWSRIP